MINSVCYEQEKNETKVNLIEIRLLFENEMGDLLLNPFNEAGLVILSMASVSFGQIKW